MKKSLAALVLALVFIFTGAFEDVTWQGITPFIITSQGEAKAALNCSTAGPCDVLNGPVNGNGGGIFVGSLVVTALGTPSAGTVLNVGTAGSTTYTYACVGQDINGNETVPSATFTTTTGNATLSATNFNRVFCGGQTGAVAFRVLKTDTAHKIGVCFTRSGQACSFDDLGVASTAYTAQTTDQTGAVTGGNGGAVNGGSITLNGSVSGTLTLAPAATTTSYTLTFKSAVPALGDILDFSNGTGQISSLVDVATGSVITSGGVGALPAYSTTPTLGLGGTTSGTLTLSNATGAGTFTLASAANTTTYTLTAPTAAPGTALQVLKSTTGGVGSWGATEAHLGNAGGYGNNTNFPTGNIIVQAIATNAGHFTQLVCNNQSLNAGSCTTAPVINVFDGAANTGTTLACSNAAQATKGTTSSQSQTQTFAAGDVIGIFVSTQGATCLAPTFSADATVVYP